MSYTIQAGDTFWSISQKLGISVDALQAANSSVSAGSLQVGQTISVPSGGAPPATGPSPGGSYVQYSGPAKNFPDPASWASYDTLWPQNQHLMSFNASADEINMMKSSIDQVSQESGVDARVILVIVVQESGGNPRVATTNNGVRNPGLMQTHNGSEFNPADPAGSILQMIKDGAEGTSFGDGLKQCYAATGNWYSAFRKYNSGSVNENDLNDPVGATALYVQKAANRLMGHTWDNM